MPNPRCRHRLPSPQVAGAVDVATLKAWAAKSPHLRPCILHKGERGTWNWIDRKECEGCGESIWEE